MTETSNLAYSQIQEELGQRQQFVLNGFKTLGIANARMIKEFLGIPINQITGRILELREERKCLTYSHTAECPYTKRQTEFWKLTAIGEKLGNIISDPKAEQLILMNYIKRHGDDYTRYESDIKSSKGDKTYQVELKIMWSGEERFNCDCYDFINTKQRAEPCKHINALKIQLKKDGEYEDNNSI